MRWPLVAASWGLPPHNSVTDLGTARSLRGRPFLTSNPKGFGAPRHETEYRTRSRNASRWSGGGRQTVADRYVRSCLRRGCIIERPPIAEHDRGCLCLAMLYGCWFEMLCFREIPSLLGNRSAPTFRRQAQTCRVPHHLPERRSAGHALHRQSGRRQRV